MARQEQEGGSEHRAARLVAWEPTQETSRIEPQPEPEAEVVEEPPRETYHQISISTNWCFCPKQSEE